MRPHRRQPTRLHRPWDSPDKSTGVGCHFLLQWMKMKNESEVAQSCPTLSDPMDCSPPGSSVHGIFQARALEWGAIAFPQAATADPILRARRMGLFFWRSIFKPRQDLEDKNNSPNLNFQTIAVPPPGTSDSLLYDKSSCLTLRPHEL